MLDSKNPKSRATRVLLLPVFWLLLLACMCQYDPYAYLLTTEKPKSADVVGTYALKEQTLVPGGLKVLQGKQPLIELHHDKTFSTTDFPIWNGVYSKYELYSMSSVTGTWDIDTVGGVSNGNEVKSVWGIRFRNMPDASLTSNKLPYGLMFTYGDPDSGTVVVFERVK